MSGVFRAMSVVWGTFMDDNGSFDS